MIRVKSLQCESSRYNDSKLQIEWNFKIDSFKNKKYWFLGKCGDLNVLIYLAQRANDPGLFCLMYLASRINLEDEFLDWIFSGEFLDYIEFFIGENFG